MEDDLVRLEPRVARIEGEFAQLNSRLAGVEVDLRDFRKSVDQKLDKLVGSMDKLDAKPNEKFQRQDAKLDFAVERLDARCARQDERFQRQDAKFEALLEKLDGRFAKQDERFQRQDARLEAAVDKLYDRIDWVGGRFESKLEALSTRHFTVWLTVISSAATIAGAVLAIIFGSPHGH